jgi:hypothetical protein
MFLTVALAALCLLHTKVSSAFYWARNRLFLLLSEATFCSAIAHISLIGTCDAVRACVTLAVIICVFRYHVKRMRYVQLFDTCSVFMLDMSCSS